VAFRTGSRLGALIQGRHPGRRLGRRGSHCPPWNFFRLEGQDRTSVISETRGSSVRSRAEILRWLDIIRFGARESGGDTARAVARRFRIESPIASAAASIRSICFLTSCKRRARLSISSKNSSVAICELAFVLANFNNVTLFLAEFFRDIMVAPFLNCYQFRTLSRSGTTDKRQRAPFQRNG
jgi:hypothetical protein